MPIEEFNDLNVYLSHLFLEISFLIAFYFSTQRGNTYIAIKYRDNENCVYYLKKTLILMMVQKKMGQKDGFLPG